MPPLASITSRGTNSAWRKSSMRGTNGIVTLASGKNRRRLVLTKLYFTETSAPRLQTSGSLTLRSFVSL
uniref:Uncharacterized protein n=1 Tax=Arundo donax TaxID=35708 RepID=A0A0A9FUV4_ARUDO